MFRLTQQSQALKERNMDTPIIPSDNSSKFSNTGTKQAINATNSDWRSHKTCCPKSDEPLATWAWLERGVGGGRGQTPAPSCSALKCDSQRHRNPCGRDAFSQSENISHFQKANRFWLGGEGSGGPRIEGNSGRNSDSLLHSK